MHRGFVTQASDLVESSVPILVIILPVLLDFNFDQDSPVNFGWRKAKLYYQTYIFQHKRLGGTVCSVSALVKFVSKCSGIRGCQVDAIKEEFQLFGHCVRGQNVDLHGCRMTG